MRLSLSRALHKISLDCTDEEAKKISSLGVGDVVKLQGLEFYLLYVPRSVPLGSVVSILKTNFSMED